MHGRCYTEGEYDIDKHAATTLQTIFETYGILLAGRCWAVTPVSYSWHSLAVC